jgi:hypothetical protein
MTKQELFNELMSNQLTTIPPDKKFSYNDLKRLCNYITTSIFDEDNCTLWSGHITNQNNIAKGMYINFFFNRTKKSIHRLLYINFIGELSENEYLKFTCENRGKCCNVTHLHKFKINKEKKVKKEKIKKEIPKAASLRLSFN